METADGPVRFRIFAGAAHSWSTLILESEPGATFVYRLRTGELVLIHRDSADTLIAALAYRPWLGSREWTSLAALPVARMSGQVSAGLVPMSTDLAAEHPAE